MDDVSDPAAAPQEQRDPERFCSRQWDRLEAPAWGSATGAAFWLAVEQPGPWGVHALIESRLDPAIGGALDEATRTAGGRTLLIRLVGDRRHGDQMGVRRVFLAGGAGGAAIPAEAGADPCPGPRWLLQGLIDDPGALLRVPWEAVAAGDVAAARAVLPELTSCPTPILLVCTNGKRDQCCAVRGRAVAHYAAGQRPGAVWECTHTGGHRYAPTGVLLPSGAMLGRLDGPLAVAAVDAASSGRLPGAALGTRHLRGLAHLDPREQAADAYVRARSGETSYDVLSVAAATYDENAGAAVSDDEATSHLGGGKQCNPSDDQRRYDVTHRDGRRWSVLVTARRGPVPPVSCGKPPGEETTYVVALA